MITIMNVIISVSLICHPAPTLFWGDAVQVMRPRSSQVHLVPEGGRASYGEQALPGAFVLLQVWLCRVQGPACFTNAGPGLEVHLLLRFMVGFSG